jgi:hypothetical protein
MEWFTAVEAVTSHVVRIATPQGTGTGFLLSRSANSEIVGVATAAHVINHAHFWEQPIRLQLAATGEIVMLREPDRAIVVDEARDTAAILFQNTQATFPKSSHPLIEEGYHLKVGNPIGWLGYPAIGGSPLCFFTGTVSAWQEEMGAYFVDGVAINGVSGGPAFATYGTDHLEIIGVVSAYMPNRVTGETLPGLGIVRDVKQFHAIIRDIRSLDDAKAQETPPAEVPPPATPNEEPELNAPVRRVP